MSWRTLRIFAIPLLLAVIVGLAGIAWLVSRPAVSARSGLNALISIECSAATAASAGGCQRWGDAILATDPAPNTFEREDLRRVALDRSLLGFGGDCTVAFFISRYDDPVWSGAVPCR